MGWLSVDADECPPHVFGVTEADRLRDAFDRFGSRFYAAAGQIDAEPFHEHEIGNGTRRSPLTPFTTRARERRVGGGASEWSLGRTLRGAAEPPGDERAQLLVLERVVRPEDAQLDFGEALLS